MLPRLIPETGPRARRSAAAPSELVRATGVDFEAFTLDDNFLATDLSAP
jgi:hypothetical protein